jgi:N-acetyl-beta-hexosaminidase
LDEDAPRFRWRGLMLDSVRHFFPMADVKMLLDQMGQHKLNVLHFHLMDDQGWRIEIQRYPELTKIGAWRTPPSGGGADDAAPYGGFYTPAEIREIVSYAAARHITIVPEIDLPGHAQAAIAAHPQIGVLGDRPKVSANWGVNEYLDNQQSRLDDEPAGRLGAATLSQVYNAEVVPAVLTAEDARRVLGAQADLWSEYLLSSWRNFDLANRKGQTQSYPAQTPFGELVVYRDRCEAGVEMARAALPDPAGSDNRQRVQLTLAAPSGEHDLCFIFTAPTSGPLYAIDEVRLLRP